MLLTRRLVLAGSTMMLAGALLPLTARRGWSVTTLTAGDVRVDSVSDGHLVLPADSVTGTFPVEERAALIAQFEIPADQVQNPCNVTLLRQGDRVVLFDVGSGPDFMPTAGKLAEALATIDVAPDDVTDVVFTHGHPDHLWGLLDDFDEPLFANAALQMGQVEFDYWSDPDTVNTIDPARQSFAVGAKRRLDVIADQITLFADGDEVVPGVRAVVTPGHTPGHTSFMVGTPDSGVFITGDAIINGSVAFARPELPSSSDQDPTLGAQTRVDLLGRLADEKWRMLGFHLPSGGIGRVDRAGDAFVFMPEA